MRVSVVLVLLMVLPALAFAQMESDQVDGSFLQSANPRTLHNSQAAGSGVLGTAANGSLLGIDTVVNWSSYFYRPGIFTDPYVGVVSFPQFTWPYTMVGHAPFQSGNETDFEGETTSINAPIVPVVIDLRNADGSPRYFNGVRMILDASKYVEPVLESPVFARNHYSSSGPATQISDAIQRAEFFNFASSDWHTLLRPHVKTKRTMVLLKGTYRFAVNPDNTLRFVLVDVNVFVNKFFPPTFDLSDNTTVIGQAEFSRDIRTSDISTFLFPDTYLYIPTSTGFDCCILGFHSYDSEQGDATNGFRQRYFVLNYSSWISPGLFRGGFQDVTALSHEIAETYNDPFVNNATPWWLAPNGNCQDNLETGDVIEGLPNAVYPITMNGFTYHPQNEALLEWFAGETPSSAISGAYSYPDTGVLTSAPDSQLPGCTGVFNAATAKRPNAIR